MDATPVSSPSASPATATNREAIVDAAIAIADAEGLEAVSMRRLAEKLGVGTMTPYTYVESKAELLDLMRDEIGRAMLVPEPLPDDWRAALRAIAMRTRDAFEAHPWVADARSDRPRIRLNLARHIEQSIAVIERLGVGPEVGAAVLSAVDDYVIGHCLRRRLRQRTMQAVRASESDWPALDPEVAAAIESGELRRFGWMLEQRGGRVIPAVPPEADFERGLDWLLDGIEALAASGETPPPRRWQQLDEQLLDGLDAVAEGEQRR